MRAGPPGYELVREIGPGIWEAVDQVAQRRVAIGFGFRALPGLARVRHPNVAAVYLVGEVYGEPYIVHELGARSVRSWLAEARRTDLEMIATWRTAMKGLAALHRERLVHGCISPDHVFVEDDGRVFVGAFTRDIDLSARYSAPELLAGAATSATDQYAAAASLREALGHGHAVAPILSRATSADPRARFSSVSALSARLGGRRVIDTRILIASSVVVLLGAAALVVQLLR